MNIYTDDHFLSEFALNKNSTVLDNAASADQTEGATGMPNQTENRSVDMED